MPKIGTTRFNAQSWNENDHWREKNVYAGCIYGVPTQIKQTIAVGDLIFMLEMKNNMNQVGAVGMIKNISCVDKYYNIYSDHNYNRYIYKSIYRITREEIQRNPIFSYHEKIMRIFDKILFTGAGHYKRGQGITFLSDRIAVNKHIDFITFFKKMFIKKYGHPQELIL